MTVREAILTLNANVIFACERSGFDSATVKMVEDALDTIEDALKAQEPPTSESISSAIECLLHPQDADDSDMAKAIDTAVRAMRLLKAQEPRVMTLDEVKMLDSDYYYLESMRSPGKELREIVGAYGLTCVTWPSITWARQTMGDSGYAKTWRCWTSRPTEEQREATPWEQ
jgi:hypothetical protein